MGRVLRVFDFDDTLAKSTAYIYVTHKDGTETTLDPHNTQNTNHKGVMSLILETSIVC